MKRVETRNFLRAACGLLMVLGASGCGESPRTGADPVYPVSGVVTYNGAPVVGADVTFFHESGNRSSFGRTNDKGEYQLTTFSSNDGAPAGKCNVTIVKVEAPPEVTPVADIETEAYVPPTDNESTNPVVPSSNFPEKYADQQTSGLVAVVNADAPNTINFELKE